MSGTGTAAFGSAAVVVVAAGPRPAAVAPPVVGSVTIGAASAGVAKPVSSTRASAARPAARSAACRAIGRDYSGRREVGADHRRHVGDRPAPQAVLVGRRDAAERERAERVAAVQRAVAA